MRRDRENRTNVKSGGGCGASWRVRRGEVGPVCECAKTAVGPRVCLAAGPPRRGVEVQSVGYAPVLGRAWWCGPCGTPRCWVAQMYACVGCEWRRCGARRDSWRPAEGGRIKGECSVRCSGTPCFSFSVAAPAKSARKGCRSRWAEMFGTNARGLSRCRDLGGMPALGWVWVLTDRARANRCTRWITSRKLSCKVVRQPTCWWDTYTVHL